MAGHVVTFNDVVKGVYGVTQYRKPRPLYAAPRVGRKIHLTKPCKRVAMKLFIRDVEKRQA
jgi:hypothetical protein